jgi:hypothetical protein
MATAQAVGPRGGMMTLLSAMEANDVALSGFTTPKKNPILPPLVSYFDVNPRFRTLDVVCQLKNDSCNVNPL